MNHQYFYKRHIGISEHDLAIMLETLKVNSIDELISEVVPESIRLKENLNLPVAKTEFEYTTYINNILSKNKVYKNYIGMGYYPTITPSVIQRNLFENPGWYTSYTPYQAEISQGRLESLLNFQTMICDLTKLDIANASLLDEATAAAEAMTTLFRSRSTEQENSNKFFISNKCFPQTIDVLISRAEPLGIDVVIDDEDKIILDTTFFGLIVQNPNNEGAVKDFTSFFNKALQLQIKSIVIADLLSLAIIKAPGEMGAHIAVGSSQRFGVPMGYGGPSAAFFACVDDLKRNMPGRIIGISKDSEGNLAYRMALQTREQHIRRDKATSNICTAQALLANMAAMYAVYHGPEGIKNIALNIHKLTQILFNNLPLLKFQPKHNSFFDTIVFTTDEKTKDKIISLTEEAGINLRYFTTNNLLYVGISINETTSLEDINQILQLLSKINNINFNIDYTIFDHYNFDTELYRTSSYLTHNVFNKYHSELLLMRYLKKLENKDISLTHSMIPLGSCTMKLNAATEMMPLSSAYISQLHPYAPKNQVTGIQMVINELEKLISIITGLPYVSLQPNSGAQGEYAGLMVIRAYLKHHKQSHRNIVFIPSSAHGTNPASAALAGMQIVIIQCDTNGNVDIEDLKNKIEQYKQNLAVLMVTYPSTHGVFEENIKEICSLIHQNGGFVYMDGANMNAQAGLTNPSQIGADVCHLNLHKTFAIPHGGGGPGMGPIAVHEKLAPYLPGHSVISPVKKEYQQTAISAISASQYGSASILIISHAYILMLGKIENTNKTGIQLSTEYAILNANYIQKKLEPYYTTLYKGKYNRVAHELILDLREYKKLYSVEAEDIAKRLADYGFHSPTLSFPVVGTLMIEPTESESKEELDRFCNALISIYHEIQKIASKEYDTVNNPIKKAPHTHQQLISDTWDRPYSREIAAYPLPYLRENKYWPTVSRIDNVYGDRNLVCSCLPIESYK